MLATREIIVDNFAGGGGASTGIELATGESVDIAINHDRDAIAMHEANHPNTIHYCEDVWDVDPREAAAGRPVGLVWLSPDCKHHSKARGGKPVDKKIRGLAWIAVRWAATVKPRVIMLENVEEFKTWGPLMAERDPDTGRLMKKVYRKDGKRFDLVVSDPGEVVPKELRSMVPDPKQVGRTFNSFVNALKAQGYEVDWRELRACDYGAPTIRKRLFLIARRDGKPIVWPKPTHGAPDSLPVQAGRLKPWRTAAEIIDWSIPCKSIFGRNKPLSENTLRRIFRGIERFVIHDPRPFIIKINHGGDVFRGQEISEPMQTITSKNGWGIVAPTLIQMGYGERPGQEPRVLDLYKPVGTVTAGGNKFAIATAFLAKHYGGGYTGAGNSAESPLSTITATDHNALVTSHLVKLRGTCKDGQRVTDPMPTITAGGLHVGEVRTFLQKYASHPSDAADGLGLVKIDGILYQIVDIGMRMLEPHELFAAQGFPSSYIIDRYANGKPVSKAAQVARCGNSVSPVIPKALVQANLPELCVGSGKRLSLERYKEEEGQLQFSM